MNRFLYRRNKNHANFKFIKNTNEHKIHKQTHIHTCITQTDNKINEKKEKERNDKKIQLIREKWHLII